MSHGLRASLCREDPRWLQVAQGPQSGLSYHSCDPSAPWGPHGLGRPAAFPGDIAFQPSSL
jgi:hypothetical protein